METRAASVRKTTPSGKRGAKFEEEAGEVDRGTTRSGALFTRQSRGHYESMSVLRKVHKKLFLLEPTFYIIGEKEQPSNE